MIDVETQIRLFRSRYDYVTGNGLATAENYPWDVAEVERELRQATKEMSRDVRLMPERERRAYYAANLLRKTALRADDRLEHYEWVVRGLVDLCGRPEVGNTDSNGEKVVLNCFGSIPLSHFLLTLLQQRLFASSNAPPGNDVEFLRQFHADFDDALVPQLDDVQGWEGISDWVLQPNWGHGCSVLQLLRLRYGPAFSRELVEHTPTFAALNRLWHAVLWNADPWVSSHLLPLVEFHESGAHGLLNLGERTFRCDPIADRAREFDDLADDISREQARVMLERRARYEAKLAVEALRKAQPLPDLPPDWVDAAGAPLTRLFAGNFPVFYGMGTIEPEGMDNQGNHFAAQVNGMLGTAMAPLLHFNTGLHTGKVHLAIWLAEAEPPLPHEAWDELVEAPYRVEPGNKLYLRDWEGSLAKRLRLPAGSYRVRMGAARMGQAQNWPDGRDKRQRPIERYALAFWPAPQQPDAVLREACSFAKDGHDLTRERSEEAARQSEAADAREVE